MEFSLIDTVGDSSGFHVTLCVNPLVDFYAPNFGKVEGAYCFGLACVSVRSKFKIRF